MKCKMVMWFFSDLMFKLVLLSVMLASFALPIFFKNENFIFSDILSSEKAKTVVKSTGSTSMSHIIGILSNDFMSVYPGCVYEKSETGSGTAAYLVKNHESDIGDMSRYMNSDESSDILKTRCFAFDGIAVIVNNSNGIYDLSMQNLRDIFSKKLSDWSEISEFISGKIVTVGREEGSGTRDGFEKGIKLENSEYDIILPESGDILAKVSNEPGAIGYISLASASPDVHTVKVDGFECSAENIRNGIYPLIRPFLQVYIESDILNNEALEKWYEYLNSERAKNLIEGEKLIYVQN